MFQFNTHFKNVMQRGSLTQIENEQIQKELKLKDILRLRHALQKQRISKISQNTKIGTYLNLQPSNTF